MKKKIIITILVIAVVLVFFIGVVPLRMGINNKNKCEAVYINGSEIIKYNGVTYLCWGYYEDAYIESGQVYTCNFEPYQFLYDDTETPVKRGYILDEDESDYGYIPDEFTFYSKHFDENSDFIKCWVRENSSPEIYIKEGFKFPTIENNEIDEVWMSGSSSDESHIKDKTKVDKIVECAKSKGEIELDKDLYDYIKKNSYDYHCIHLKYKGYPLAENFFIEETEDGRYVINQYTKEEYEAPFFASEAH